jgi:hypothetical protein
MFCLRLGSSNGASEHGIELWVFIKCDEFFDQFICYYPIKKYSAPRSYLHSSCLEEVLEVGILECITPAVSVTDYCPYQAGCWLPLRHIEKIVSFLPHKSVLL